MKHSYIKALMVATLLFVIFDSLLPIGSRYSWIVAFSPLTFMFAWCITRTVYENCIRR